MPALPAALSDADRYELALINSMVDEPAEPQHNAPVIDELLASLQAVDDYSQGRISEHDYQLLNAAYEAKHPQPVSIDNRAPWDRDGSNLSAALRKELYETRLRNDLKFAEAEAAKIATNFARGKASGAQGTHAVAQGSSSACPVVALLPPASSLPSCPVLSTVSASASAASAASTAPVAANQNCPSTPWSKTSGAEKLAIATTAAEYHAGVAFSLNLSPARERALRLTIANGNDPARSLSHEINRALKPALSVVPPYSFVLEVSPTGSCHLHGVMIPPDPSVAATIKEALMKAGGKLYGHQASRQVKLKAIYYAAGWHGYITEDLKQTARTLGTDKITFISQRLTKIAREFHEPKPAPMAPAVTAKPPDAAPSHKRPGKPAGVSDPHSGSETPTKASTPASVPSRPQRRVIPSNTGAVSAKSSEETKISSNQWISARQLARAKTTDYATALSLKSRIVRTSLVTRSSSKMCSGPVGAT